MANNLAKFSAPHLLFLVSSLKPSLPESSFENRHIATSISLKSYLEIMMVQKMKTILILDNEEMLLDAVAMSLSSEGYRVIAAGNEIDALNIVVKRKFKGMPIDLIVTDINTPYLSYFKLLTKLKSINVNLPIFAITVGKDGDLEFKLISRGYTNFFEKPFSIDGLGLHANALSINGTKGNRNYVNQDN